MMREYPQICGGTHLLPYKRKLPRIVERVTAQGSVPWFAWWGSHTHPRHQIETACSWADKSQPLSSAYCWNRILRHSNSGNRKTWSGTIDGAVKPVEQPARQLLFWNFFLFGKEKSGTFPLNKRKNYHKNLSANKKQSSFSNGFIEYEKSYEFHILTSKKSDESQK